MNCVFSLASLRTMLFLELNKDTFPQKRVKYYFQFIQKYFIIFTNLLVFIKKTVLKKYNLKFKFLKVGLKSIFS